MDWVNDYPVSPTQSSLHDGLGQWLPCECKADCSVDVKESSVVKSLWCDMSRMDGQVRWMSKSNRIGGNDWSSLQDGCNLWGSRVVVPPQGHAHLLVELHRGHPGVSRVKGLARSLLWWPGLDHDIESTIRQCNTCQQQSPDPAPMPLQPWS